MSGGGGPFPQAVLRPYKVKALRDRLVAGEALTPAELFDLVGSHEQLRAIALTKMHQLRVTKDESARLQGQLELIARAR